jgi:hypothetical protein
MLLKFLFNFNFPIINFSCNCPKFPNLQLLCKIVSILNEARNRSYVILFLIKFNFRLSVWGLLNFVVRLISACISYMIDVLILHWLQSNLKHCVFVCFEQLPIATALVHSLHLICLHLIVPRVTSVHHWQQLCDVSAQATMIFQGSTSLNPYLRVRTAFIWGNIREHLLQICLVKSLCGDTEIFDLCFSRHQTFELFIS